MPLPLLLPYLLLPRLSSPLSHHSGYLDACPYHLGSCDALLPPPHSPRHILLLPQLPLLPHCFTLGHANDTAPTEERYLNCTLLRNWPPTTACPIPWVCLPAYLPTYCTCMFACLSASLSICLPASLSVCLPLYLFVCLPVCLSVCLPACRPASLSVCLSVSLSDVYPSVWRFAQGPHF